MTLPVSPIPEKGSREAHQVRHTQLQVPKLDGHEYLWKEIEGDPVILTHLACGIHLGSVPLGLVFEINFESGILDLGFAQCKFSLLYNREKGVFGLIHTTYPLSIRANLSIRYEWLITRISTNDEYCTYSRSVKC